MKAARSKCPSRQPGYSPGWWPCGVLLTAYTRPEILLSLLLMATIVSLVIAAFRGAGRRAVSGRGGQSRDLCRCPVRQVPDKVGIISVIGLVYM